MWGILPYEANRLGVSGFFPLELSSHIEIGQLERASSVVVFPVGSIEQHGPHLPLNTDSFLATRVAETAARQAAKDHIVVLGPTIDLGISQHHMDFPGTISVSGSGFVSIVSSAVESLAQHGFYKQILVNGHGGNHAVLSQLVQELGFRGYQCLRHVNYWSFAADVAQELRESPLGGMGHACEFETSLMLHLRPDLVRRNRIKDHIPIPRDEFEVLDMFSSSPATGHWRTSQLSPTGVLGAPELATAEKGRVLFEHCVNGLARLIATVGRSPCGDVDPRGAA